jgi:uncharacterized membrane protein
VQERNVDAYLRDLDRALRDLPPKRRREIVSEIQEHIADKFEELPDEPDDADIVYALEQVGEPEEIALEARERFGIRRGQPSWSEPVAIILLLVGGFLWGIGWVAGVVLLWLSDVWSTRDKLMGTLLVPGGLASAFFLLFLLPSRTCAESTSTGVGGTVTTSSCSGGMPLILAWAVLIFLLAAPIFTAVYLGRRLRQARREP